MTETTRNCRRCGVDISDLRRDATWCRTCPKRELQNLPARRCVTCDAPFQPRRKDAVCCSRACNAKRLNRMYAAAKRGKPTPRPCPACAQDFLPKRSDQRYCSATCGARARYKPAKRPNIPCAYCGKVFAPPQKGSTVCSRVCSRRMSYAKYRKRRVAASVAWARANRDARAAISNQYKAQRRRMEQEAAESVGVSSREWVKLVRRYRHCCAYCGAGGPIHMEHVIPLSRGGRHAIGNVLPACATCNLSKQADLVSEWKLRKARIARVTNPVIIHQGMVTNAECSTDTLCRP